MALLALVLWVGLGCERRETPAAAEPGAKVAASTRDSEAVGAGRWRRFRTHRFDPALAPATREQIERLEAIGYASGSQEAPDDRDVVVFDRAQASPGTNLYVSGHAPEAVLMDMAGNELHRWRYAFWDAWPEYPIDRDHEMTGYWRRAHLFENGDLLAIFEGLGLIKLNADSRLLWAEPIRAHHDLEVLPNGDIYVLTREAHLVPRVSETEPILEDFLVILTPDGVEKRKISLLEALEASPYADMMEILGGRAGDIFHANTLHVLNGRAEAHHPAFRAGNVLLFLLGIGVIAVLDVERGGIVWASQGAVYRHDPKILENGNLLIFDNHADESVSSVLEYASLQPEPVWEYRGSPDRPFFSDTCGTAERLPNGNTLITESDAGRAFEVTSAGEIVWEFWNPHRAGSGDEFIATLFELLRLPPTFPLGWAEARRSGHTATQSR